MNQIMETQFGFRLVKVRDRIVYDLIQQKQQCFFIPVYVRCRIRQMKTHVILYQQLFVRWTGTDSVLQKY